MTVAVKPFYSCFGRRSVRDRVPENAVVKVNSLISLRLSWQPGYRTGEAALVDGNIRCYLQPALVAASAGLLAAHVESRLGVADLLRRFRTSAAGGAPPGLQKAADPIDGWPADGWADVPHASPTWKHASLRSSLRELHSSPCSCSRTGVPGAPTDRLDGGRLVHTFATYSRFCLGRVSSWQGWRLTRIHAHPPWHECP